jgi:hypothetical protein
MNSALDPLDEAPAQGSLEASRIARLAPRPTTLAETGLSITFLADLVGKHLANSGVLALSQLIDRLALAGPIVEQLLLWMRKDGRVEVRARAGMEGELRFGLTERGRSEALDAMMRGGYLGPAPVPLQDYVTVVCKQTVHDRRITRTRMREAFRDVVISDALLDQLGPALNSGRAIFVYGSAGTGKTFIAKRLAEALPGLVLVPHAIAVNETVIQVFDPLSHLEMALSDSPSPLMLEHGFDPRYALCERPIVISGGELTAEMLEVHCDATTREYNAPLQLKANNGLLLIDDLGRQRIQPEVLFNRWIVPMEEKRDFLTAGPGQHFTVPFDLVLVFSTNLDPHQLADEAFLRRIGYKISFKPVSAQQYRRIWDGVCAERDLCCEPGVVDYVIHELHARRGVPLLPCHPRDLLGMAVDRLTYGGAESTITTQTLLWAWDNYFVEPNQGEEEC